MKIAYLGPKGTYTEKISKELFPEDELIPIQPIRSAIFAVENNKVDLAVVPLENFYNGEVRETIDSLTECKKAKIITEKSMEITHCLGVLKDHGKIIKIFSKDQALEQCSSFLTENFPNAQMIAIPSTAEAVLRIKSENILDAGVIASKNAILESGLEIINTNLVENNKTRFIVIGKEPTKKTGDDKTFISIHPPEKDKQGILYNVLGFLANNKVNMEDIKSRPDKKSGYYFYIELDGHEEDANVKSALESIKKYLDSKNTHEDTIKILGSYKNSHWKEKPEVASNSL